MLVGLTIGVELGLDLIVVLEAQVVDADGQELRAAAPSLFVLDCFNHFDSNI